MYLKFEMCIASIMHKMYPWDADFIGYKQTTVSPRFLAIVGVQRPQIADLLKRYGRHLGYSRQTVYLVPHKLSMAS